MKIRPPTLIQHPTAIGDTRVGMKDHKGRAMKDSWSTREEEKADISQDASASVNEKNQIIQAKQRNS